MKLATQIGEESHGNLFGGSDCEINWSQVELNPGVGTASGSNAWEVLGDNSAEPVLSKPQFDRFLGHAFLSLAQTSDLKMPWEVSGQPVDSSLLSKL